METNALSLKALLEVKQSAPHISSQVVNRLTEWLCSELDAAEIEHHRHDSRSDYFSYSRISLYRSLHGIQVALEIKIAEIDQVPQVFANVRLIGHQYKPMFPYFSELKSDKDKEKLLHYIVDFILGVRSGEMVSNPRFAEKLEPVES
ncbi:hypothetical protein [Coraliomargarita parva]|uniref:hypothetical protein n=1 Tax=Coraliomargarita parva TaxID=3014050 RepID=UPI0022B44C50|nr:hypothetical protein [Coraliomargarita parva]